MRNLSHRTRAINGHFTLAMLGFEIHYFWKEQQVVGLSLQGEVEQKQEKNKKKL